MSGKKVNFRKLRDLLLERRGRILDQLQQAKSRNAFDASDAPLDSAEEAAELFDKDMLANISDTWSRELKDIDDALMKIEKKDYGLCAECGEGIGHARLQAIPSASLCIECQEKKDDHAARNTRRSRAAEFQMIGGRMAAAS